MNMKSTMGASERMSITKKRIHRIDLKMRTRCTIHRTDRATGRVIPSKGPHYNTLTADAIDSVLNVMTGVSSQHLDQAAASVKLTNTEFGGDIGPSPLVGADVLTQGANTKSAPATTERWEFHDDSVLVYDCNWVQFWNGDPGGGGSEFEFSKIDISAEGSKPSNENWHYIVELELYSTDVDFTSDGLRRIMQTLIGESSAHFDETNVSFRPMDSASTEITTTPNADQLADAAPVIDIGANTVTWTFTAVDGDYNGTWTHMRVKHGDTGLSNQKNLRSGGCKTDGSSCGTKAAGEEWVWTYVWSLAQGSP